MNADRPTWHNKRKCGHLLYFSRRCTRGANSSSLSWQISPNPECLHIDNGTGKDSKTSKVRETPIPNVVNGHWCFIGIRVCFVVSFHIMNRSFNYFCECVYPFDSNDWYKTSHEYILWVILSFPVFHEMKFLLLSINSDWYKKKKIGILHSI